MEDPAEAYARRQARAERAQERAMRVAEKAVDTADATPAVQVETTLPATGPLASDEPNCPKCGGRMWDNRLSKRNPKAPNFKCRNRSCDGVVWPPKAGQRASSNGRGAGESSAGPLVPEPEPAIAETDQIPF